MRNKKIIDPQIQEYIQDIEDNKKMNFFKQLFIIFKKSLMLKYDKSSIDKKLQ